jgi:hypothetical protein
LIDLHLILNPHSGLQLLLELEKETIKEFKLRNYVKNGFIDVSKYIKFEFKNRRVCFDHCVCISKPLAALIFYPKDKLQNTQIFDYNVDNNKDTLKAMLYNIIETEPVLIKLSNSLDYMSFKHHHLIEQNKKRGCQFQKEHRNLFKLLHSIIDIELPNLRPHRHYVLVI